MTGIVSRGTDQNVPPQLDANRTIETLAHSWQQAEPEHSQKYLMCSLELGNIHEEMGGGPRKVQKLVGTVLEWMTEGMGVAQDSWSS